MSFGSNLGPCIVASEIFFKVVIKNLKLNNKIKPKYIDLTHKKIKEKEEQIHKVQD